MSAGQGAYRAGGVVKLRIPAGAFPAAVVLASAGWLTYYAGGETARACGEGDAGRG